MGRLGPGVAIVLVVTLSFVALPTGADHAPQIPCSDPRGCPDLVVDQARMGNWRVTTQTFSANSCAVREDETLPGTRTLLRFTFTTPNVGAGDLIVGSPETHPEWFTFGNCHGHAHFKEFSDYRLWTPAQFADYQGFRTASPDAMAHEILEAHPALAPVRGDKAGFCVIDIRQNAGSLLPPKYLLCEFQGISTGWADEYSQGLDGQWIDVTGLAKGTYVLEAEVNAERFYQESDYVNDRAWVAVTI